MTPVRILCATAIAIVIAAHAPAAIAGETPVSLEAVTPTTPPPAAEAPAPPPASVTARPFGAPITVKKPVAMAKLEKKPARYAGKTVRLEGVVRDVCQGQGCWIEIEGPTGASFLAKSLDESVLVPKDCKGWQVVVQGVVTKLGAKGHEGHEVHAHTEAEEGHACPAPSYVIATQGVELKPVAAKP